ASLVPIISSRLASHGGIDSIRACDSKAAKARDNGSLEQHSGPSESRACALSARERAQNARPRQAAYTFEPSLDGDRRAIGGALHRLFWLRLSPAAWLLHGGYRDQCASQHHARTALSGEPSSQQPTGNALPRVRYTAACGTALPHGRPRESVRLDVRCA